MTHSARGLDSAWAAVIEKPGLTEAQKDSIRRRRQKDFKFLVLCESKGNMGMYQLMRDKGLDQYKDLKP